MTPGSAGPGAPHESTAAIALPLSASPRVSVIIPAAAGIRLLLACLRALQRCAPAHIQFETIVLLNKVEPELSHLLDAIVGVRIERPTANLGLAGGGNRGRSLARGEYLILLHDDAEVEPGWMEALVATADAHPEAGAVGGKVLNMDRSLQHAGSVLWRDAMTTPPWLKRPQPTAFDRLRAVDYCGTCSLLVRAATWDAVGGLDELLYPAYYVDVDLAMSVRSVGQVVLYEPASRIRHQRSASSDPRWRRFLAARNRERFVRKWQHQLEAHHELRVDRDAGALERAMRRPEAFHADVIKSGPRPLAAPTERRRIAPAEHDLAHLQLDLAMHRAYVRFLSEQLDELEQRFPRLGRVVDRLRRFSRVLSRTRS